MNIKAQNPKLIQMAILIGRANRFIFQMDLKIWEIHMS